MRRVDRQMGYRTINQPTDRPTNRHSATKIRMIDFTVLSVVRLSQDKNDWFHGLIFHRLYSTGLMLSRIRTKANTAK